MVANEVASPQPISNDGSPICHAAKSNHDSCLTSLQISVNHFLKSLNMTHPSSVKIKLLTSDDEKQSQHLTFPAACLTVAMLHWDPNSSLAERPFHQNRRGWIYSHLIKAPYSRSVKASLESFWHIRNVCVDLPYLLKVFFRATRPTSCNGRRTVNSEMVIFSSLLWFCSLIIVSLVLITEIATWWYDHRTEQKNNTLPSHGIEPCISCSPGRRINHCTRKECWSFVSFRLMFEGEHFEHNTYFRVQLLQMRPIFGDQCWLSAARFGRYWYLSVVFGLDPLNFRWTSLIST